MVGSASVACRSKAKDQYGRRVAVCKTDTFEINRWLVDNGLAVAYRQYGTEYVPAEDAARAARRGIWAGDFDVPSDWRKERKIEQLERGLTRSKPLVDTSIGPSGSRQATATAARSTQQQQQQVSQQASQPGSDQGKQDSSPAADTSPAAAAAPRGFKDCAIKGNISAKGEKIYHKPGSRSYMSVVIEKSQGERYFCSEAEAQSAGWRPAK